ncbi:hypothetical protein GM708_07560 [Vibrio cholerae]|nr:hypothetical protein [Vibrio cholerae]
MTEFWDNAEIIHTYTRAEAITDGVLVDAGTVAREAGFAYPVALTIAAWSEAVTWTPGNQAYQDEAGRLWDVLTMAAHAARARADSDRRRFRVLRVPNRPRTTAARLLELEMHIGPGDDGDPVITIGLPGQD